ncbi:hypothetical protein ASPBRDRAFT_173837 [Aspergillus brasiliensis CBS 101740]|uniref:SWI/SNF family DNA-dependent ATPase Ris1 n=1 Tax=Aspergillus brasiliensis (strain CBS 101740 / IMI 381727 / IBT 21946) TaxID=767769 RepID=A0A1L9UNS3_ASPBC|nr:hypothetical protein ASPBRDRAFT_173837 [Aspergillus brasiliensis CBS 101740]
MASATDASIQELLEDIELNQVILQSLDEERPDAAEDRQEILDTIKRLEARIAVLQGRPTGGPSAASPPPDPAPSGLSFAQLDGAFPDASGSTRSPSPAESSSSSSSSSDARSALRFDVAHGPSAFRKRQHFSSDASHSENVEDDDSDTSDITDDLEAPIPRRPKRMRRVSPEAEPSNDVPDDDLENSLAGNEQLRQILGIDSADIMREIQEEQRRAEKWLEERREQERRDAEFARRLNDSFYEPSQSPSSTQSIFSSRRRPSVSAPGPASLSNRPSMTDTHRFPESRPRLTPSESLQSHSRVYPVNGTPDSQPLPGSDDSDLAEITPSDFQRHCHISAAPHERAPRWGSMPNGPGLQPPQSRSLQVSPVSRDRVGSGSVFGPHVMSNTMARLNAGREMLEQAGRMIFGGNDPRSSNPPYIDLDDYQGPGGFGKARDYLDDYYGSEIYGPDPNKTKEDIQKLLESIRPDSEIALQNREGTPEALRYTLLEHQKLGLSWMKSMEEGDNKGGILADDMGLGKTIQAIALIVSRPSTDPERKPTLIIAPVALVQQWKREIERMVRPGKHQLSIWVLHGDKRLTTFRELKRHDVVLTTFGTLAAELKRKQNYEELEKRDVNLARKALDSLPLLGRRCKWYRVIADEAQCIKNRNAKAALACCQLNTTYRWCMTGTPMMNNVEELHSLIKFLRIRPYCNIETFNRDFTKPLKASPAMREKAMLQLQVLLKAILLRRTKSSEIDGKPILQLPPKVSERVHAVFSEKEQEFYNALEARSQNEVNRYLQQGVGRNYSNILVLLLRLRQACCHPHLIKDFSTEVNAAEEGMDLIANAKAFSADVVARLKNNTDSECPICIDAVENPVIFFPCGHGTCAECFSRISDPEMALRNGRDDGTEVKCPNCRAKVDPKKITDHESFKKVHFPDPSDEAAGVDSTKDTEGTNDEDSDDESDDDSDDDAGGLSRFIVNDDDEEEGPSTRSKRAKGKGKAKNKKSLAELKKEAQKNKKSKLKYLRRLEKTWMSSAKIEKAMEILRAVYHREGNEKTIIFSQFTSLLDLLEIPIARQGWDYRRYDGSMRPADRNTSVMDFTDKDDCRIMLVSLKAGNAGLNLVAASQVIIFDPFWNPYVEEQAVDRAHRIGQVRPVQIHRIVVKDTVEDRILELQDKKRELVEGALDEKASSNLSRLGARELAFLFNIRS